MIKLKIFCCVKTGGSIIIRGGDPAQLHWLGLLDQDGGLLCLDKPAPLIIIICQTQPKYQQILDQHGGLLCLDN